MRVVPIRGRGAHLGRGWIGQAPWPEHGERWMEWGWEAKTSDGSRLRGILQHS